MTLICVGKLTIIGSDNGLSLGRRKAIIWTNAGILFIEPLGTNFSEILIDIQSFSFNKMYLKMASVKWRPFCFGLNVLMQAPLCIQIKKSSYPMQYSSNLVQPKRNTTAFILRSFPYFGSKLWNDLPNDFKDATDLALFKDLPRYWDGPNIDGVINFYV